MVDDRVARMQQRILKVVVEEMQGWMNDLLKGMLDPGRIMGFMKAMGLDMSQLPGMLSQQAGLNPYQVLGLNKSASDEEIKKRYRELLQHLHPNTAGREGTSFLLNMVLAAYELIKRERGWQ